MTAQPPIGSEVRRTLLLAGPLVGGQLAGMGLNFVDTVMAGKIDAVALAAVAVGFSVWVAINLFVMGVLMSLPPSIAQLDGAGDRVQIGVVARQSAWVWLGVTLLGTGAAFLARPVLEVIRVDPEIIPVAVAYVKALVWGIPAWFAFLVLRFLSEGLGVTRPALYLGLLALPVNALANWVLMFGELGFPELGAVGCGHATSLVWWTKFFGMAIYVVRRPELRDLAFFRRPERPDRRVLADLLRTGLPIGVALFIEGSLFVVVALFIGTLGTLEVAAHQIAINFVAFTFMVPLGISMAITVRVGNAVGRRDPAGVRTAARVGIGLVMAVQVVWALVMTLFPRVVVRIYTDDADVMSLAVQLILLAAIFQLSDGLQVSAAATLRGLKDTRAVMLITIVAYWVLGMPLGYALGFPAGFGAPGMWMGLIGGLTVAAVLLLLRLRSQLRRPATA